MKRTLAAVLGAFAIQLLIPALQATDYILVGDDGCFFVPCTGKDVYGNVAMTQILDVSGLKHTDSPDQETVYTNGNIVMKKTIPKNVPIKVEMEIYERKRGEWVETIYSVRRDDFCKAAFDPGEMWYSFMNTIPVAQRTCPPVMGTKFAMLNVTNRLELKDLPHTPLSGEYKAVVHFKVGKAATCMSSRFHIYRN